MIKLIEPSSEYLQSYIEAYDEYMLNHIARLPFQDARKTDVFTRYDDYRNARHLPPGWVGSDYYWLVDDETGLFIGEISIRHALTASLLRYGGHIGYGVRYSEWNKGFATMMLEQALVKAKDRGIKRVLITCDDDNPASARVMEKNGLVLEDKVTNIIEGKTILTRRYWKTL